MNCYAITFYFTAHNLSHTIYLHATNAFPRFSWEGNKTIPTSAPEKQNTVAYSPLSSLKVLKKNDWETRFERLKNK